jgi:putative tryptophan/tyrosine transport system substrate-binding protein
MVVTARTSSVANRELIIALAAHYKMPTFYFEPSLPPPEDLSHTGLNFSVHHRRAATYVNRILKGEKLADLPVQAPDRY